MILAGLTASHISTDATDLCNEELATKLTPELIMKYFNVIRKVFRGRRTAARKP